MATPVDLGQVGKLFNDTLAVIRDETPQMDALILPEAIVWLKDARYKMMREIEASYYKLELSRRAPLTQPIWVDPSKELLILTPKIPTVLTPFGDSFTNNLLALLKTCGFQHCSGFFSCSDILLAIRFPAQLGPANPPIPRNLHVEDEFSQPMRNTRFSASNFARLLLDARGGTAGGSSEEAPPQASPTATQASDEPAEESDRETDDASIDIFTPMPTPSKTKQRRRNRKNKNKKGAVKLPNENALMKPQIVTRMNPTLMARTLLAALAIVLAIYTLVVRSGLRVNFNGEDGRN
ncbi:hypothetical protein C8R43DRAFT_1126292 [Mycena crocata]|nr:hypothetical protein C8R43DRAFT_1126292 [Mycena crocata]